VVRESSVALVVQLYSGMISARLDLDDVSVGLFNVMEGARTES
jgi:hypothetical protein